MPQKIGFFYLTSLILRYNEIQYKLKNKVAFVKFYFYAIFFNKYIFIVA